MTDRKRGVSNRERKEYDRLVRAIRENGLASVDLARFKELRRKINATHRTTYLKRDKSK